MVIRRRIKPLVQHAVAADFQHVYEKIWKDVFVSEPADPTRVLSLRPSQLPFCPVGFFINHSLRGMFRSLNMAGAYYTSVGTTVHTCMQTFLPQSSRFLADYKCTECGKWHRLSHQWECCGFPCEYHEVQINYKGVTGHIDGIYLDKKGNYWILDFKTTSKAASEKKRKDPGPVYTEQVEAYAYFIYKQYKIKVKGVMLVFVARDNPQTPVVWTREITEEDRARIKNKFVVYRKMQQVALDVTTEDQAVKLFTAYGRCVDPMCEHCPKDDQIIKSRLRNAFRRGKAGGFIPIRAVAERALALKAKHARSK